MKELNIKEFPNNQTMLRYLRGKAEIIEPIEVKEEPVEEKPKKKKSAPKKKKEESE